jgi:hypothetical protein
MRAPEADEAQAARCLALPAGEARAVAAAIAREG